MCAARCAMYKLRYTKKCSACLKKPRYPSALGVCGAGRGEGCGGKPALYRPPPEYSHSPDSPIPIPRHPPASLSPVQ
eukprot:scaffold8024_cov101-Isochrysis_galbana.AAC.3